jgi:N-acyl homoserine lactone hydrolase
LIAALTLSAHGAAQSGSATRRSPSPGLKLYVFDCGILEGADVSRFGLKVEEVATIRMSVACYLVVHPKGTLMWDVGAVSDMAWTPTGKAVTQTITLPDLGERKVTVVNRLSTQLVEAGYQPDRITHLALSHYHWDHTANANQFKNATWLVRQQERDGMFPETPSSGRLTLPASYSSLRTSKTVIIKADEHDVFGDGTVVAKLAPGHTPGHQVLFVKLAQTGPVVLSGDLYHYPEERTLDRLPIFEFNKDQTRATRAAVDRYLKETGAQFWIQHDFSANAKLKKSPAYYQ